MSAPKPTPVFSATTNACKACTPLGACLAFRGVEGCVPFLHGSQGCSTYIRRYMIGHYREPIDIASSNFSESSAIFGGGENFCTGIENVIAQYDPSVIGVATTCLAETIGDDMNLMMHEYRAAHPDTSVPIVHVSTPSYTGTHAEGFHAAVRALADQLAEGGPREPRCVNLMPGMVSPADIRHLRELCEVFDIQPTILPDYSDTLDGGSWREYHRIPEGGTSLAAIRAMGRAAGSIEFTSVCDESATAAPLLSERFDVTAHRLDLPIGIDATDQFCQTLSQISGRATPKRLAAERARLIDAYIDGHKYLSGTTAALYGEEDLVVGLTRFCCEIGITPVLCASGGNSGNFETSIRHISELTGNTQVIANADFAEIEAAITDNKPDLMIGYTRGYAVSRRLDIPLVRVGFPVSDRIGAARLLHVGYRGTQQLFDRIVNTLIEAKQDASPVGYMTM